MTKVIRILIAVIMVLSLSIVAVSAQDVESEREGYMVHLAKGGVITPNVDGTYTLTLESAADFNSVVLTQPELSLFNYYLSDLAGDWAFANETEAIVVNGQLELDEVAVDVTVTVGDNAFDILTNNFTYVITIEELPAAWLDKGGNVKSEITFATATLAFEINDGVIAGLVAGRDARLDSTRNGGSRNPPCC
ncbi:MAG: hypothetical protein MUE54_05025 [Anaerolineae bacterium]|jgi:hypothetical protein|nr:hypothetical protein [Anaerolineae bacterium]